VVVMPRQQARQRDSKPFGNGRKSKFQSRSAGSSNTREWRGRRAAR